MYDLNDNLDEFSHLNSPKGKEFDRRQDKLRLNSVKSFGIREFT